MHTKTVEIVAEVALHNEEPQVVEVIITVDTERPITLGMCQGIIRSVYPNRDVGKLDFRIIG